MSDLLYSFIVLLLEQSDVLSLFLGVPLKVSDLLYSFVVLLLEQSDVLSLFFGLMSKLKDLFGLLVSRLSEVVDSSRKLSGRIVGIQ